MERDRPCPLPGCLKSGGLEEKPAPPSAALFPAGHPGKHGDHFPERKDDVTRGIEEQEEEQQERLV